MRVHVNVCVYDTNRERARTRAREKGSEEDKRTHTRARTQTTAEKNEYRDGDRGVAKGDRATYSEHADTSQYVAEYIQQWRLTQTTATAR